MNNNVLRKRRNRHTTTDISSGYTDDKQFTSAEIDLIVILYDMK
jgi:hypothetical protein